MIAIRAENGLMSRMSALNPEDLFYEEEFVESQSTSPAQAAVAGTGRLVA